LYLSREFYKNVTRTIFTNEINQFSLSALKKTDLFAGGEQPFCRQKNAAGSPFLKPGRSRPNLPNSSFFCGPRPPLHPLESAVRFQDFHRPKQT
jgi:hypothetical protein